MFAKTSQAVALLALLLPSTLASFTPKTKNALIQARLSPQAQFFFAWDPNFTTEVTQRWTAFDAPTYFAAIKPATVSDVQEIVKVASLLKIPFMATGAGHAGTTTSKDLHGLQIDLSTFDTVQYNAASSTIKVGGGVRFGDIYDTVHTAGKEIQVGSGSCVGMVGATLGGGIGRLQGLHGLILDALLSVEFVTAAGNLITASKTQNSDLFWAIRGTGANFGIVVSATYQLYPATNGGQYLVADFIFPASSNRTYWEILKSFDTTLPAGMSLTTSVSYNATRAEAVIKLNAVYAGPKEEGLAILDPFFANSPFKTGNSMVTYNQINSAAFFGTGDQSQCEGPGFDGLPLNIYGLGLKQTDVPTFVTYFASMANLYLTNPSLRGLSATMQRFPTQAVVAVADDDTSYGHREIINHLLFINAYAITDNALTTTVDSFMVATRNLFQPTSGFSEMSLYSNYAHGDEGVDAWYGSRKIQRLTQLKKLWDPKGLFSWTNPLPLN